MGSIVVKTNLPNHLYSGKVRDTYFINDEYIMMVSTDRISAFDVVMNEAVPGKGEILNLMSTFWLEKTKHIIPNHFVCSVDDLKKQKDIDMNLFENHIDRDIKKRSMIVKKAKG